MDAMLGQLPASRQYFLGAELMVAPVTAPAKCASGGRRVRVGASSPSLPCTSLQTCQTCQLALVDVWLPPARRDETPPRGWFALHTGTVYPPPPRAARNSHSPSI